MTDIANCSISKCSNKVFSGALCKAHYTKLRRYGDPHVSLRPNQNKAMPWLLKHVDHTGEKCLVWPFAKNKRTGYGKAFFRKKHMPASRAMCILAHGEPPTPKHQAAHTCGMGHIGCVNPQHLRWVLPHENCEDRVSHGTFKQLTKADKEKVKRLRADFSQAHLSKLFGVSQGQISRAITGSRSPKYR